jgi:hypothetical protein
MAMQCLLLARVQPGLPALHRQGPGQVLLPAPQCPVTQQRLTALEPAPVPLLRLRRHSGTQLHKRARCT